MGITASLKVSDEIIKGLLCSAFEGGSNYWYQNLDYDFGKTNLTYEDFKKGGKMQDPKNYWHPCQLVPLVEGCSLTIEDGEDSNKTFILDRAAIERGVQVMAEKYPQHFADILTENGDATTGDVFLQCCLFGDTIYG